MHLVFACVPLLVDFMEGCHFGVEQGAFRRVSIGDSNVKGAAE